MNDKVLEARRALFETWHCERFKTKYSNGQPTRDMHNGVYAECYTVQIEQERWIAFNAAIDAVEIELPASVDALPDVGEEYDEYAMGANCMRRHCIAAIESTNLGLRVK